MVKELLHSRVVECDNSISAAHKCYDTVTVSFNQFAEFNLVVSLKIERPWAFSVSTKLYVKGNPFV